MSQGPRGQQRSKRSVSELGKPQLALHSQNCKIGQNPRGEKVAITRSTWRHRLSPPRTIPIATTTRPAPAQNLDLCCPVERQTLVVRRESALVKLTTAAVGRDRRGTRRQTRKGSVARARAAHKGRSLTQCTKAKERRGRRDRSRRRRRPPAAARHKKAARWPSASACASCATAKCATATCRSSRRCATRARSPTLIRRWRPSSA